MNQRALHLQMLREEATRLQQAADHLRWSYQRCQALPHQPPWTAEDLEKLESLSSRFARLADVLTQRLMRLADELELEAPGSLIDRLRRAEKRGWATHDGDFVRIRELRNLVAHEYADDKLAEIYQAILALTPALLAAVPKVVSWAAQTG